MIESSITRHEVFTGYTISPTILGDWFRVFARVLADAGIWQPVDIYSKHASVPLAKDMVMSQVFTCRICCDAVFHK